MKTGNLTCPRMLATMVSFCFASAAVAEDRKAVWIGSADVGEEERISSWFCWLK
jgi:hypothetical protein